MSKTVASTINNNDDDIHSQGEIISSVETCGFVTYILCFPFGFIYICWIIISDESLHAMDITYYPSKSFVLMIPTMLFILFIITPFTYAFMNYISSPSADSIYTLWDESSNVRRRCCNNNNNSYYLNNRYSQQSDNDENDDGMYNKELQNSTMSSTSSSSCIPSIYDIDVSIINQLIAGTKK